MKRKHADCALAPLVISPRRKSQRAAPLLGAPGGKVPEDPPRKPASTPSADAAAPPPCAVLPGAGAEQQQQEMHGGAADMAFAYHTTRNGASAAAGERMCPAVPHGQSWMLWVLVRGGGMVAHRRGMPLRLSARHVATKASPAPVASRPHPACRFALGDAGAPSH